MDHVADWRIHLGAHKTASTHLQDTLSAHRDRLIELGVDFLVRKELRRASFAGNLRRMFRHPAWYILMRRPLLRQRLHRALLPLRRGPTRVVLSEENLLGTSADALGRTFYGGSERMIRLLASIESGSRLSLFLAVRSQHAMIPSAYAQALRWAPLREPGFEPYRRRVVARPPSWFEFLTRLRRAVPDRPIRVWRYEDYSTMAPSIVGTLCGVDTGPLPEMPVPRETRSPTAAAVAEVEKLPTTLPIREWRRRVDEIYAAFPAGPRFAPFTAEERGLLKRRYAEDIRLIREEMPGTLIE